MDAQTVEFVSRGPLPRGKELEVRVVFPTVLLDFPVTDCLRHAGIVVAVLSAGATIAQIARREIPGVSVDAAA